MSDLLISLLVAIHLLAVNLAAAAPLVSIWHEWQEGRGSRIAGRAGRALLGMSLACTIAGAILGLLIGSIIWNQGLSDAVGRVPSKISYGVMEILFSFVLTSVQLALWSFVSPGRNGLRVVRMLLALLAGTNLIYHFPILFSVLTELIHHGQQQGSTIDSAEFRQHLIRGAVLARTVHFALAAFATCGVALMIYSQSSRAQLADDDRERVARWGGRWAVGATVLQIPVGIWLVTSLSSASQTRLMGGDTWGTSMFVLGLFTALWLAHVLASIAFGETSRRVIYRGIVLFVLVIVLMSGASRRAFAPATSTSGMQLDESSADR